MGTFTALIDQLDPVNKKRRGDQGEAVGKFLLQNDPVLSREFTKVWLWKDWPYDSPTGTQWRWKEQEAGIDLVAQRHDGSLCAVQVKAYQEGGTVPRNEIAKFLAESARPVFKDRLLITTADHVAPHAADAARSGKGMVVVNRAYLEDAQMNWPDSLSDLRAPKRKPKKPWPHVRKAINAVVKGFDEADRGKVIMACGTGKTFVGLHVRERLLAQRTLVVVPTLSLLAQTLSEWRVNQRLDFRVLPVCSDDSVRRDPDEIASSVSELGLRSTTDAGEIAATMRQRGPLPLVVFSTYQSLPKIAEAFRLGRVPAFDLIIVDEAHHAAGPVISDFATILSDKKIPAKRRLFMTATQKLFTARVVAAGAESDFEIASMDDEAKFGKEFHFLSFGEAIDKGLLTDFQVAIAVIDKATDPDYRELYEKYRRWIKRRRYVRIGDDNDDSLMANDLTARIALVKAMRAEKDGGLGLRRGIAYTRTIVRAKDFAQDLPKVNNWMPPDQRFPGPVWAKSVDGTMSVIERRGRISGLRDLADGTPGVVSNARCLGEGIDIPNVDFIEINDPKRSVVEVVQAVGRAVRLSPGKDIATILIPIVVDSSQDPDDAFNVSAYRYVRNTLLAMRSLDERLADEFDRIRREGGPPSVEGGVLKLPSRVRVIISDKVAVAFVRAFNMMIVEMITASFEEIIGALERYKDDFDDINVPQDYVTENGVKLGLRLSNLRARKKTLAPDRIERLDKLGMVWDANDADFQKGLRYAEAFRIREGHVRIKKDCVTDDDFKLGQWWANMRARKEGLSEDRIQQLEALGMEWQIMPKKLTDTERQEIRLAYVEKKGTGRELAQQYGVGKSTISYILRNMGVKTSKKKWTDAEKQQVRLAYVEKKVTQAELARQYGVDQASISKILRGMGIKEGKTGRRKMLTDVEEQEIRLASPEKRGTVPELAQRYGVSTGTIYNILKGPQISRHRRNAQ